MSDRLKEIEERAKSVDDEWEMRINSDQFDEHCETTVTDLNGNVIVTSGEYDEADWYGGCTDPNRNFRFIANAPSDIRYLLDLLRQTRYDEAQRASVQICGLNPAQIQELILFAKSYGWRHPGDTP